MVVAIESKRVDGVSSASLPATAYTVVARSDRERKSETGVSINVKGNGRMKHRALACAGVVLGVVLMMSSYAVPMASAAGGTAPTAMITSVGCPSDLGGALSVTYEYSGFPGSVRTVDFQVANAGDQQAVVKGGTGPQGGIPAFFAIPSGQTAPYTWGVVTVQLLGNSGNVIKGSTMMSASVTC